jgi:hypothetical protein
LIVAVRQAEVAIGKLSAFLGAVFAAHTAADLIAGMRQRALYWR